MKVCAEHGCPELTKDTRCLGCTRAKDKARGTRQERGYGAEHRRMRAGYQRRMDSGERFACWRCGDPIDPKLPWDLGHHDKDRTRYAGPEHVTCNRATSGRI